MNNNSGQEKEEAWKREAKKEWEPFYKELQRAINDNDAFLLVNQAKEIALKLKEVETTQMRKFLDEIVKVHPKQINIDVNENKELKEDLSLNDKNKLAILRPRFAYTVARKNNSGLKGFYIEILDKWLEDISGFKNLDLEYLHLFIESLIAYHKVHAEKVNAKK